MIVSDSPLDIERPNALRDYLRATGRIARDETIEATPLAGGVSNRTVLAVRPATGERWVVKQALAKLRVRVDWFSDPARVHREAEGLRWLERLVPDNVPRFVFEDFEHHLLAMSAVPNPHDNWKTLLLAGRVEAVHVEQFARLLATIHRDAAEQRKAVAQAFGDRSFFESLRLEPYYAYTAEQCPDARGFLHDLINDTRGRRLTLVHGDYSPKNVLVHTGRLVLLDYEVIHFGDPAFDVGFAMTHLLSKARHLHDCRDAFTRAASGFWQVYCEGLGDGEFTNDIEPMAVRHTLSCMLARVAGRSQLEYLDDQERAQQRDVVVGLMSCDIVQINDLLEGCVSNR